MATIEERKYVDKETGKVTVRYRAKIRLKGFAPEECTFPNKTLAKEWVAKREYELKHEELFGPQHHKTKTVSDMLERYENSLKLSNPKRHKGIAPFIKFWKRQVGHYKLQNLTADIATTHREALQKRRVKDDVHRKHVTNASVNRVFGVLKCALNVAVKDWKWLTHNPLLGVKNLKESAGRTRYLSSEELDRLLAACEQSENTDLLTIVSLAITTGARRGEIMKVRLCKPRVKDSLRSPSTADFPFFTQAVYDGNSRATLASYVDAQNGFGATVRTNFICVVEYSGGGSPSDFGNWKIVDFAVLQ